MRSKLITRIIRDLGGMTIGYAVIVVLTSTGFNGVLGGRPLYGGSPLDSAAGMMVAIISGLAGGCIAGFIGAERGTTNAGFVLIPLVADTIYVLFFFKKSTAPFWFDAMASATLMLCTVFGGILRERIARSRKTITA
jgi:hypothetical protein